MARLKPEPAVDKVDARVPGVPVGHPRGGAAVRVLHVGGQGCLTLGRVRAAQADALAVQGELRAAWGGAVAAPRDLQLMVAGFEAAGVNSGDVTGPDPDLDAARAFFTEHGVELGAAGARGAAVGARPAAVPAAA